MSKVMELTIWECIMSCFIECLYNGDPIANFELSDRELKVLHGEPGGPYLYFLNRFKRMRPGFDADAEKFDYTVGLGVK